MKNAFTSCAVVLRRPCFTSVVGCGTSAGVNDTMDVSVGVGEGRKFSEELAALVGFVGRALADSGDDGNAAVLVFLARHGAGGGDSDRARRFSDGTGARPERRRPAVSNSSELDSSL